MLGLLRVCNRIRHSRRLPRCLRRSGLHQALEIQATGVGSDRVFTIQPGGLAAGSRWSARVKGADHRVNAHPTLPPEWVPEPGQAVFGRNWKQAGFTCERTVLASRRDANRADARVRWSFPLRPRNDHRLPSANPPGWAGHQAGRGKPHARPHPSAAPPRGQALRGQQYTVSN